MRRARVLARGEPRGAGSQRANRGWIRLGPFGEKHIRTAISGTGCTLRVARRQAGEWPVTCKQRQPPESTPTGRWKKLEAATHHRDRKGLFAMYSISCRRICKNDVRIDASLELRPSPCSRTPCNVPWGTIIVNCLSATDHASLWMLFHHLG